MRLHLWSWNYAPEPTAMGPIATVWAQAMRARGHEVEVVTAHPHYPGPLWGQRARPYRERRDGVPVVRLPLWIGHGNTHQRVREELTYMVSVAAAMGLLGRPDAAVVVSPSFLALAPTVLHTRLRRLPWVLWLEDILPDAAATTGFVENPLALGAARKLERVAYREADRIVVISRAFRENLLAKGVAAAKIDHVFNPFTRGIRERVRPPERGRVLYMGNMGFSQNLPALVRAFEAAPELGDDVRLAMAGTGELLPGVEAEIRSSRIELPGLLYGELDDELERAAVGLVPQRPDIDEFNLPSKLMTLMAWGIPVLASVNPTSEVARVVRESGGGWVVDAARPEEFPRALAEVLARPQELARRGAAGLEFARRHFTPEGVAERFEEILVELLARRAERPRSGGVPERAVA